MPTIYDLVTSKNIAAYYDGNEQNRAPFLGEMWFPNDKKLGLDLSWIKGAAGIPVALKPSAFDSKAMVRDRIGVAKVDTNMPFFKEAMNVDETQRQELNKVIGSANQDLIDSIVYRIFDDETTLLDAAAVTRERMRMQLLTSGKITIVENGTSFEYDYGLSNSQKETLTSTAKWDAPSTCDPIGDIEKWQNAIETATGVRPNEAICNVDTFNKLVSSAAVKNLFKDYKLGVPTRNRVLQFLKDELSLTVYVYDKSFKANQAASATKYVANGVFVLLPSMELGKTWFGTTPEESDLLANPQIANVSVVDLGVAITTSKQVDPVNVQTKVSQICLPSFPQIDKIFVATTY